MADFEEDPYFELTIHTGVVNMEVMLTGDSIYKPGSQQSDYVCKINRIAIECVYEIHEGIWHTRVRVLHGHQWDEIYTDLGFKKEIGEYVFGLIMEPSELFEKTILA